MKVLIVDDEIGKLLQGELQRQGWEVEYTTSPADLRARLSERAGDPYEVLLLNLDMLEVGGLQLLEEIREIRRDLDVIVITADGDEDKAIEAIRLGAIDYLRKPIALDEIRTALFRVQQKRVAQGRISLRQRVLVVDDEKSLAARMKGELDKEGYEVTVAYDGIAGLEYFRNNHVDAVIADIRMPGMDGLEMLEQCRVINPDFVSIVITAFGDQEKAIKSLKLGVFDYLKKPISLRALTSVVSKGIDLVALRRSLSARQRELEIESALKTRYAEKLEEDITERKKAQEALQKSEEKYRTILENMEEGYYEIDIAGYFRFFNDSLCKILGYPRDELMQMNNRQNTDEENARKVYQTYNEVYLTGETVKAFDWEIVTREGAKRYVEASISPISDPTGQPTGFKGILRDITERKRIGLKLRERSDELEKVNKELEDYTAIVSHDLRAPLRSIQSFTSFLIEGYMDKFDDQGKDYLDRLKNSSLRMQQLIEDLLTLSWVGRRYTAVEMVDLSRAVKGVKDDLKGRIDKAGAEIIIHDLPTTPTQWTWIGQLFRNLIDNALKYNESKLPRVEIEGEEREDDYLFKVKDNGIGIEDKHLGRVFNIFERLHPQAEYGGGTGAGLAICKRIVENWGGKIWVQSKVGEGSIFYFNIPKVSKMTRVE